MVGIFLFLPLLLLKGNLAQAVSPAMPEICGPVTLVEANHGSDETFQPVITIGETPYTILNQNLKLFTQDWKMANYAFNHGKSICAATPDGLRLTQIWLIY